MNEGLMKTNGHEPIANARFGNLEDGVYAAIIFANYFFVDANVTDDLLESVC